MDLELAVYSLTRILHVSTAIVLVGGTFFMRFILMPAATAALTDTDHARLREGLISAWKKFVHGGISLLLATGAINYYRVIVDQTHKGDPLYHALLGTKILLAMGIFFIASALVGRAAGFESLRKNARKWLTVNLILAAIIVGISGFLKVRGTPNAVAKTAPPIAGAVESK